MKTSHAVRGGAAALAVALSTLQLSAQTTAFTYQGFLTDQGAPANSANDFEFRLFNAASAGTQQGSTVTLGDVGVTNGLFTVALDFGYGVFTGDPRWLEIGVRTNGGGAFAPLTPRQKIAATPYALHAAYAGDIEPGARVVFSGGTVTFAANTPFLLGPFATNTVMNLSADKLDGIDSGSFWQLGGNSGQLPGSYVLGTLDSNAFELRASGGIRVHPETSLHFGQQTRQMLNLWGTEYGIGVQNYGLYSRTPAGGFPGGFYWYQGGTHNENPGNSGGGVTMMSLTDNGLTVRGTFVSTSDRGEKENFEPLNPREVLDKVAALPLSKWSYKQDSATRHLGPMAQDFYAAFGVGPDDKHIATVDADGVALATIQSLNQKVEAKNAEISELKQKNTEMETRLNALEKLMKRLSVAQNEGGE